MTKLTPSTQQSTVELSARSLILGLIIGTVMTAANTYLGLYAGMTVSASIPAAIVSMGILRGLMRRGTILENNIVQTVASAGESVAAGIIFTVPALVIAGVWTDFPYWKVTFIGLLGGVLGVLFMIPLRRTLIVEDKELVYPEGVACAQVLEAGETGGRSLVDIALSLVTGLIFKSLIGLLGVFRATVEGAVRAGNSLLYFGTDVSVALLGVGVIVGLEVAALVFLGGAIGWLVGIPIYYLTAPLPEGSLLDAAWDAWEGQIRYMGVGSMIIGGLWSMWSIRAGMMKGVREAIAGFRGQAGAKERTDEDIPASFTAWILALAAVATVGLYYSVTGSLSVGLVSGVVMVVACFFFVAVSSYIVGLVGSSNNPISGMTICALMFASVVLLVLGMSGTAGVLGALGVAGVVCCAAATAGDTSQDLKTGYLVGATPRRQQIAQFIGVVLPTFAIAPILTLLHTAYGIGTGAEQALRAPQATLFASITQALFGQGALPWTMVFLGAGIGVALIFSDEALRRSGSVFRTPVMPVAVGIYLPLSLSVPIFAGGLLNYLLARRARPFGQAAVDKSNHRAVLISSGLIAGEAIAGILIAFPRTLPQFADQEFPIPLLDSGLLTLAALFAVVAVMYWACRAKSTDASDSP
jgi:putative OPT family oligopeptide transporter